LKKLVLNKKKFKQEVMLFNAELPQKIQSKVSNQTLAVLVFTELQEASVLDLIAWVIKELSSPHIMTLYYAKLFALIELTKERVKNFTELLMNSELEESRPIMNLSRTYYLILISMPDKLILHLLIQLQNFLNLMRVQSQESKGF